MKMTRQHFVRLAELCSDVMVETNATKDQATKIMELFLRVGYETNPNFSADRFDSAVQKNLGFSQV